MSIFEKVSHFLSRLKPNKQAAVGFMSAVLVVSALAPTTALAYEKKTVDTDLSQLNLTELKLTPENMKVVHKSDQLVYTRGTEVDEHGKKVDDAIDLFAYTVDKKNPNPQTIENPVEMVFENAAEIYGKKVNLRVKVNSVTFKRVNYQGTQWENTFTQDALEKAYESDVVFATVDHHMSPNVVQFNNYPYFTIPEYNKIIRSYYSIDVNATYTLEYADGTPCDLKMVMRIADIDVTDNSAWDLKKEREQNEQFDLPKAMEQASKVLFNKTVKSRITEENGTLTITSPSYDVTDPSTHATSGGNSADWQNNKTGAAIRANSNSITFVSKSASASGTDFGAYVEGKAPAPVKAVDLDTTHAEKGVTINYTATSTLPQGGKELIDTLDSFAIEDEFDERLDFVSAKVSADGTELKEGTDYTIKKDGQKVIVELSKDMLTKGIKEVKVEYKTITNDNIAKSGKDIENIITQIADGVRARSNTVKTELTYNKDHEFFSKVDGVELPENIKKLTPDMVKGYKDGETVSPEKFTVPEDIQPKKDNKGYVEGKYQVADDHGVWTFDAWDAESKTVEHADVHFRGGWDYKENLWGKDHKFYSKVKDTPLPDEITKITPANVVDKYKDGEKVNADDFDIPAENKVTSDDPLYQEGKVQYKTADGVWTFDGWDEKDLVIDHADVHFNGGWTFEKNPPTPTPETPKPSTPAPSVPQTGQEPVNVPMMVLGIGLLAVAGGCVAYLIISDKRKQSK